MVGLQSKEEEEERELCYYVRERERMENLQRGTHNGERERCQIPDGGKWPHISITYLMPLPLYHNVCTLVLSVCALLVQ